MSRFQNSLSLSLSVCFIFIQLQLPRNQWRNCRYSSFRHHQSQLAWICSWGDGLLIHLHKMLSAPRSLRLNLQERITTKWIPRAIKRRSIEESFGSLYWLPEESPLLCSLSLLAIMTCHRFFTALSVLPGKSLAISAHLLPNCLCEDRIFSSSSALKPLLLILGSSWLHHRSLQLFAGRRNRQLTFSLAS